MNFIYAKLLYPVKNCNFSPTYDCFWRYGNFSLYYFKSSVHVIKTIDVRDQNSVQKLIIYL